MVVNPLVNRENHYFNVVIRSFYFAFLMLLVAADALGQSEPQRTGKPYYPDMDSLYRACVGHKYVPFDVTTLDGKRINNESCLGKVTFITFWFEACFPCRAEFGKLNELYDSIKNDRGYEFIAITFDSVKTLPDFIRKTGIRYPVATVDDKAVCKKLNYSMGYPSSIILDKNGRIAFIAMKAVANVEAEYEVDMHRVLAIMRKALYK